MNSDTYIAAMLLAITSPQSIWTPRYEITAFNRAHRTPRDGSRLAAAEEKRARKAARNAGIRS